MILQIRRSPYNTRAPRACTLEPYPVRKKEARVSALERREHWLAKPRLPGLVFLFLLLGMACAGAPQTDATTSASRAASADATSSATKSPGPHRAITSVLYDAAQGPALRLCLLAAGLGILYRAWQFRRLTRALHRQPFARSAASRAARVPSAREVRRAATSHPVMKTASFSFHLFLFLVPLLLPAHNLILHRSLHVSLPSIPSPIADWLTMVVVALGAFFLARRILVPRVRVLSTAYDYAVLLLVLGPFVTGLMAYHHVSSSPWLMIAHVASADLLLLAVPFTKLGHMPFLIFSRFFVSGEYAWRQGRRAWGGSA